MTMNSNDLLARATQPVVTDLLDRALIKSLQERSEMYAERIRLLQDELKEKTELLIAQENKIKGLKEQIILANTTASFEKGLHLDAQAAADKAETDRLQASGFRKTVERFCDWIAKPFVESSSR